MFKRKISKISKSEIALMKSNKKFKELLCSQCSEEYITVPIDVGRVTCSTCIMGMVGGTGITRKVAPEDKRPRGWHKKPQYISPGGKKYIRGVEVENFPNEKLSKKEVKKEFIKKPKELKKIITIDEPKRKRGRPPKNKK